MQEWTNLNYNETPVCIKLDLDDKVFPRYVKLAPWVAVLINIETPNRASLSHLTLKCWKQLTNDEIVQSLSFCA